jgi:exopolysaccharide biosynthesis predicted pyruvyltransferase EpsI
VTSTSPQTVGSFLAQYAGRKVYLHEVAGNNGDELILKGSEFLIDQARCDRVSDPSRAELILINGGFKSDFWPHANETIRDLSARFPAIPLAILPSSFLFEKTDFPALFSGRTSPATLFARELQSLEILNSMAFDVPVTFGLDHDTAFALRDDPKYQTLAQRTPTTDVLIVERGDAESSTGHVDSERLAPGFVRTIAATVLPRSIAMAGARTLRKLKGGSAPASESAFITRALALAEKELGRPVESRVISDISRRSACDFDGFCDTVADARVVVSTRLHVGILGSVLGRRTFAVAGNNHKIPGIYEYSMKDDPNSTLINPECEVIG